MMKTAIQVEGLSKRYGQHEAVKGISFTVQQGTLFAFLGANGAGKSTTIEILCTLLKKQAVQYALTGIRSMQAVTMLKFANQLVWCFRRAYLMNG